MKRPEWQIRLAGVKRRIFSAAVLRTLIRERTGVTLSPPTVEDYFRDRIPSRVDQWTLTAILNTLACPLSEVVSFAPPATRDEAKASPDDYAYYHPRGQRLGSPPRGQARGPRRQGPQAGKGESAGGSVRARARHPPDLPGLRRAWTGTGERTDTSQPREEAVQAPRVARGQTKRIRQK